MKAVPKSAAIVLWVCLIGVALGLLTGCKSKSSQGQPASGSSGANQSTSQQPWPGAPTQEAPAQPQASPAPAAAAQVPNQPPSNSPGAADNAPDQIHKSAGAPETSATGEVRIPEGTQLYVRLVDPLGSARDRRGDRFTATLDRPIAINGDVVVPQGAKVTGRVLWARPSGHLRGPAELGITLTRVQIGNQIYRIETYNRTWRGRSHKRHDAKWIAGLGGVGALIGGIAGHGEGLAIGAASGAGAGTVGAFVTGKKNIYLPSETPLHFVLRRSVEIHGA